MKKGFWVGWVSVLFIGLVLTMPISLFAISSPSDISGVYLWLDGQDPAGEHTEDGTAITNWVDLSTNSFNATQNTATAKPTYNVNVINGYPGLHFDGSDDFMTMGNLNFLSSGTADEFDFFIVLQSDVVGTHYIFGSGDESSENDDFMFNISSTPKFSSFYGVASWETTLTPVADTPYIINYYGTGGGVYARSGRTMIKDPLISATLTDSSDSTYIGAYKNGTNRFFDGKIGEIIIYNSKLSTANRNSVDLYLANRWGIDITVTLDIRSTSDYDYFGGGGILTATGNLVINDLDGSLSAGNSFDLIQGATSISGYFESITLPALNAGLAWDLDALYATGVISVVSVPGETNVDPVLWFDAEDFGSIMKDDSDKVSRWTDKMASGYDFIQTNSARQPTYNASSFNGSDSLSFVDSALYNSYLTNTFNVFIVYKLTKIASAATVVWANSYAASGKGSTYGINESTNKRYSFANGVGSMSDGDYSWDTPEMAAFSWDATNKYQFYVNSVKSTMSNNDKTPGDPPSGYMNIGSNINSGFSYDNYINGNIAEIILFDNSVSTSNRLAIDNYLANKWAIPITTNIDIRSSSDYDFVTLNGTTKTPTGDLTVAFEGFSAAVATFNILRGTVGSGTFDTITVPDISSSDLFWVTANLYADKKLYIIDQYTWDDGGGADNDASTTANWSFELPLGNFPYVVDSTSSDISWDTSAPSTIDSLTLGGTYTGNLTFEQSSGTTITNALTVSTGSITTTYNLTVGAFEMGSSTTFNINLDTAAKYGKIASSGTVTLNGSLVVSIKSGYTPTADTTYDILDWSSLSGRFTSITLPSLGAGLYWDLSQLYSDGKIIVRATDTSDLADGTTPRVWFDASAGETIATDNNGLVMLWIDKSGNGYNVSQTTSENQPTYNMDQINSLPVVTFDGSNDILSKSNVTVQDMFDTNYKDTTAFMVGYGDTSSSTQGIWHVEGSNARIGFLLRVGDGSMAWDAGAVSGDDRLNPLDFNGNCGQNNIWSMFRDGDYMELKMRGVTVDSKTASSSAGGAVGTMNIPVLSYLLKGQVAEILVYNTALSTSNRLAIDNYLANKWAIPITTNIDIRSSSDYDFVTMNGTTKTPTGDLTVAFEGFSAAVATFNILRGTVGIGTFDTITVPDISGSDLFWVTENIYVDKKIYIIDQYTWDDGGGADNDASTTANWDFELPLGNFPYVVDSTSSDISWDTSAPSTIDSLTIGGTYSGNLTFKQSSGTTITNALTVSTGSITTTYNLTVGAFEMGSSSTMNINLDSAVTYGKIASSGTVTLNGSLVVSIKSGYTPTADTTYDILDWSSISGRFTSVSLPSVGNGQYWDLSQLYTDGKITVRATDTSDLLDTSPILWLDAAAGETLATDNSNNVSLWIDKSGNNHNPQQSILSQQPNRVAGDQNNQDVISLTSANSDYLNIDATVMPLGNSARTYFVVSDPDTTAQQALLYHGGSVPGTRINLTLNDNEYSAAVSSHRYGNASQTVTGYSIGTWDLPASATSSEFNIYANGQALSLSDLAGSSQTINTASSPTTGYIGRYSTTYHQGKIAEIIVYDSKLSTPNRLTIENYLANKWAVAITTNMDIRSSSDYDFVTFNNTVISTPTGNLNISFEGFSAEVATFNILRGTIDSGMFDSITLPDISASDLFWVTSNIYATGEIYIKEKFIWDSDGGDDNASTWANWDNEAVLGNDPYLINSTNDSIIWDSDAPSTIQEIALESGFTGSLQINQTLTVENTVTLNAGTIIVTSNSNVTLNIQDDFELGDGATLNIVLASTSAYGRINVTNTANLLGDLKISVQGYTGNEGDEFTILALGYVSGNFNDIELPTLTAGLAWDLSELSNGKISVTAAPGGLNITPMLWFDASDIGSVVTENGTAVRMWLDKSGQNYNVAQVTADSRPVYDSNVFNANAGLRFDGSDDYFMRSNIVAQDFFDSNHKDNTVFVVGYASGTNNGFFTIQYRQGFAIKNDTYAFYDGGAQSSPDRLLYTPSGYTLNTPYLWSMYRSGTWMELFKSGISQVSKDSASGEASATAGNMYVGALGPTTYPFSGYINEIIVYKSALSTENRQAVEEYLVDKYFKVTWDNGGGDYVASTKTNWSNDATPNECLRFVIDYTTSNDITWDLSGDHNVWQIEVTGNYTGTITAQNKIHTVKELMINNASATVDVSAADLEIGTTLNILAGELIQATHNVTANEIILGSASSYYTNKSTGDIYLGSGGVDNSGTMTLDSYDRGWSDPDAIGIYSTDSGTARPWVDSSGTYDFVDITLQDQGTGTGSNITVYSGTDAGNTHASNFTIKPNGPPTTRGSSGTGSSRMY